MSYPPKKHRLADPVQAKGQSTALPRHLASAADDVDDITGLTGGVAIPGLLKAYRCTRFGLEIAAADVEDLLIAAGWPPEAARIAPRAKPGLNNTAPLRIMKICFEDPAGGVPVFTTNCVGPLATILRKPRQARKGATVA